MLPTEHGEHGNYSQVIEQFLLEKFVMFFPKSGICNSDVPGMYIGGAYFVSHPG